MAFGSVRSKSLAAQARRGNLRALDALLREISDHIDGLSVVELAYIDGVTAGTGLASKALVLDSSGDVNMPDGGLFNRSADTVAAAGSSASDAAALGDQITIVTAADGAKGVVLPAAADLGEFMIVNDSNHYALKVYPVNSGDDLINELAANEEFNLGPGQTALFKAISATQWYTDKSKAGASRTTHFERFDDFGNNAINTTDNWITFGGSDGNATAAAIPAAQTPEGSCIMLSGNGNGSEDGAVISTLLPSMGSLISLGTTVFECRVSLNVITGCSQWFGLCNLIADTTERMPHTVDSGTVADGGYTVTDVAGFSFSTDATLNSVFTATSENAGTIVATEQTLTDGPSVNVFNTLRLEIDDTGDARWYIDGVLRHSRATAVATAALLIPYIAMDSGTDAQSDVIMTIDYIYFSGARPSSNA